MYSQTFQMIKITFYVLTKFLFSYELLMPKEKKKYYYNEDIWFVITLTTWVKLAFLRVGQLYIFHPLF